SRSERSCPGLYQALKLGGRRSVVPSCTHSSPGCCGASREQSREHLAQEPIATQGECSFVSLQARAARLRAARRAIWVSSSEHPGAEIELVHVAVGADMEGDVDTIGLPA